MGKDPGIRAEIICSPLRGETVDAALHRFKRAWEMEQLLGLSKAGSRKTFFIVSRPCARVPRCKVNRSHVCTASSSEQPSNGCAVLILSALLPGPGSSVAEAEEIAIRGEGDAPSSRISRGALLAPASALHELLGETQGARGHKRNVGLLSVFLHQP